MGLRGPGAKAKTPQKKQKRRRIKGTWRDEKIPLPERVISFLEQLPITAGTLAGQKMKLREWQKDFIQGVYGPNRNGLRLVRTGLLSLPRKQGKTALAAGLALAHLCGPCAEIRGQVYSAASDRNQAGIIFNEMVAIIERVEWLNERLNIKAFNKIIEDFETGSTYSALSSDARKAHGLSPSFVVCDEIAQWKSRELYDNLVSGMGARAEPLTICIGTQAADDVNLMSELVDYAEKINSGEIEDETFHGVVYAAPMDADPWAEATWYACNPALGDFKSLTDMRAQADQAQRIPARIGPFRNLHLNQRISAAEHFISRQDWLACASEIDVQSLYGRPCWAGLDLSATNDLTALVLYFPEDGGAVLPFFWLPKEDVRGLEDAARVPYRVWADEKFLELTPGRTVDYRYIVRRLAQVASDFDIRGIAYDRWRIKQLQLILSDEGITLPLIEHGQGFKDMAPAVDALEKAVLGGELRHNGNPILTWNCSNAVVEDDPAGNRKLNKKRSKEKIDGIVALTMAIGLAGREKKPQHLDINENSILVVGL